VPALRGARAARLRTIEGQPPILREPPSACPFRARCALAVPRCALENPARRAIAPGHDVACHRAEDTAAPLEVVHA
jgi:peptide/nickel transport system ATP-binding protein/oligopeptide transport system ATP-binding protein